MTIVERPDSTATEATASGDRRDPVGSRQHDAGAQARRDARAGRRQQDRARRRPCRPRPRPRRPDARRHAHDQRPPRRGHDDGPRRAEHPHAAALVSEEPNYSRLAARLLATFIDKEVANQNIHSFSPVDRRRPRGRADRRRHRRPRRQPLLQAQRRDRHVERLPLRVLRAAHGLRPLPAAPPRAPPRHRDPAVLVHARRLRAVVDGRRGDRVLPPDLLARLPAGHADAVQLRHDAPAAEQSATCSTARATRSRRSTTATRTSPGCPSSPAASASPSTACAAAAR